MRLRDLIFCKLCGRWITLGLLYGIILTIPQAFAVSELTAVSFPRETENYANRAPVLPELSPLAAISPIPPHNAKVKPALGKMKNLPAKKVSAPLNNKPRFDIKGPASVINSSAQPKLTLEKIIRYTLKTNPEVLRADAQKRAARAGVDVTSGSLLPNVDLVVGAGREQAMGPFTQFAGVSQTRSNKDLSISQLLWDGWGVVNQIVAAKSQYQALNFQLAEQRELTALRVTEVYLDTLRFSVLTKLAQDNLNMHYQTLKKVHLRVEGGAGQKSDEDLARSRVTEAQATLYATQGLLNDARNAYIEVVNLSPKFLQFPHIPPMPVSNQEALNTAFRHNPSIQVAMQNIRTARANLEATKGTYFPKVSLNIGVNRDRNLSGFAGPNNNAQAMINLRYNLFKGGTDKASIEKNTYDVYASRFAYQSVPRTVRRNTMSAWQNYHIAQSRTAELRSRVFYIEKVIAAYHKQFELGQRSLFDLLEIERELFNAKSELTNSRFLIYSNAYRLLASMGILVATVDNCYEK